MKLGKELLHEVWQQFEADHVNSVLHILLLAQVETDDEGFPFSVSAQLDSPDTQPSHLRPDPDGSVLLHSIAGEPLPFDKLDRYQALRLYYHIGVSIDSSVSFYEASRRLVAVAIHGGLEAFIHAIQPGPTRLSLPDAAKPFLDRQLPPLGTDSVDFDLQITSPIDAYTDLKHLDASRHLIVHRRAVIDERYLREVSASRRLLGEFCEVTFRDLWRWQHLAYQVANHVRRCSLTTA